MKSTLNFINLLWKGNR